MDLGSGRLYRRFRRVVPYALIALMTLSHPEAARSELPSDRPNPFVGPRSAEAGSTPLALPAASAQADRSGVALEGRSADAVRWQTRSDVTPKAAAINHCEPYPEPGEVTCNPVSIRTGTKFKREVDFRAQGEMPLELVRTYNKSNPLRGLFGFFWNSSFDQRLAFVYRDGSSCVVVPGETACNRPVSEIVEVEILRTDGAALIYTYDAVRRVYHEQRPDRFAYLEYTSPGWLLHTEERGQEFYDASGVILRVEDAFGVAWDYAYVGTII